ncbi:hypothetical protein FIBSPDRAFT_325663 [Athelia psychrophila]|uniref:Uncharacterized protein n=1 Tax=Athelia psychrophila TaxID=1759441 RepID=A0A166Q8T8_9AGAM|nr:hypothetical protein FIBSPDRAFT_325663 [Fibularhizoctonia sp. CBS 109695]
MHLPDSMSLWRQVHPLCVLMTLATLTSSGNVPDVEGMEALVKKARRRASKATRNAYISSPILYARAAIGVSNFQEIFLEEILPAADITPTVNQLELHLYNPAQPPRVPQVGSDRRPDISPLGPTNSPLPTDDTTTAIAKMHRLQPSDALLGHLYACHIAATRFLPGADFVGCSGAGCCGPPQVGGSGTNGIELHCTVAAVKSHGEGHADRRWGGVGGKLKMFIMSDCGIDFGLRNWPWSATQ